MIKRNLCLNLCLCLCAVILCFIILSTYSNGDDTVVFANNNRFCSFFQTYSSDDGSFEDVSNGDIEYILFTTSGLIGYKKFNGLSCKGAFNKGDNYIFLSLLQNYETGLPPKEESSLVYTYSVIYGMYCSLE